MIFSRVKFSITVDLYLNDKQLQMLDILNLEKHLYQENRYNLMLLIMF